MTKFEKIILWFVKLYPSLDSNSCLGYPCKDGCLCAFVLVWLWLLMRIVFCYYDSVIHDAHTW